MTILTLEGVGAARTDTQLIGVAAAAAIGVAGVAVTARVPSDRPDDHERSSGRRAKNVILCIGDGMGGCQR